MINTARRMRDAGETEREAALDGLSEIVKGACALLEAKMIQRMTGEELASTSTMHRHAGYDDSAFGRAAAWQVALAEALAEMITTDVE